jgi:hypothetical protein
MHTCFELGTEQVAESYVTILRNLPPQYFVEHEISELKAVCGHADAGVRVVVPLVIGYLAQTMDANEWSTGLLELFTILSRDPGEEIRGKLGPLIAIYSKLIKNAKDRAQIEGKFSLLCRDRSAAVRKSAAMSIASLSEAMEPVARIVTIVPAAQLLLNDQDEEVRTTITSALGPLIHVIGSACDATLVSKFGAALAASDVNIVFSAAFSLPSVAVALGKKRFKELEAGFEAASSASDPRIRRTLAFGMWEYAGLFSSQSLHTQAAHTFLQDVPMVAIGAMSHLSDLLKFVPTPGDFLRYLIDPLGEKDWRVRIVISGQVRKCADVFEQEKLLPIATTLLSDPVWAVRRDAAQSVAALVSRRTMRTFVSLGKAGTVPERMAAAWVFALLNSQQVTRSVVHRLKAMLNDRVPNVRASAAKAILRHQAAVPDLQRLIPTIQQDSDPDVRS